MQFYNGGGFTMKSKGILTCFIVVLCMAFFAGAAIAADTIRIGVLAPLTGFAADDGINVKNSVIMAADKLNEEGGLLGKKVELVIYDDRADPKEAVALAYKLIEQDEVVGLVAGSYSFPTRAVAPIFNDEEIPLVSAYAIHPDITAAGKYCFRNGFLGTVEGKACAHVAVKNFNAKTVALIHADNDFGRTLAKGAHEYLIKNAPKTEIVYEAAYPFKEKDYKAYLSRIKALNPDVVIASGYFFQSGPMIKQAREMGIKSVFIGEEGSDSPQFLKIAGEASDGFVMVTNLNRDDERQFVQDYISGYRARFGEDTCMVGASAYDAFVVITEGIRKAGTTKGSKVQQAIAEMDGLDGITGAISFTPEGEVVKPLQVQIVKDGNFHYYDVITDPELIKPE
jgi:branched-chain amino acid transport system substrate-binding protein